MSSFPSLSTQRIVLSSFSTLTDTSAVFAYGSDPEVARFTSWMPHKSPADSAAWIEQINDTDSAESGRRHHCWAIRIRGDGTAVGAIEFAQGHRTWPELISYWLGLYGQKG
jgi:RimJ/RimL family protein N-acetyltransferase